MAMPRLLVKLKDGREVVLEDGVTREQLDEMLTTEDVLDEDGRHYLVGWDDVADVVGST
jgi:hypothetical protein